MITERTVVTMQVYRHTDTHACGALASEPYGPDSICLSVTSGAPSSVTLLDVPLDELEAFIAAARKQCEAVRWATVADVPR